MFASCCWISSSSFMIKWLMCVRWTSQTLSSRQQRLQFVRSCIQSPHGAGKTMRSGVLLQLHSLQEISSCCVDTLNPHLKLSCVWVFVSHLVIPGVPSDVQQIKCAFNKRLQRKCVLQNASVYCEKNKTEPPQRADAEPPSDQTGV